MNSDRSTTRVSFQFALYVFLSQRENSALDQDSLSTLSHAHPFFSQGVGPTAQRAAVIAGVELPVYDWCKKMILDYKFMDDNPYTHFW